MPTLSSHVLCSTAIATSFTTAVKLTRYLPTIEARQTISNSFSFFFLMIRPPPRSTLFPYPTLFRSARPRAAGGPVPGARRHLRQLVPRCGSEPGDHRSRRPRAGARARTPGAARRAAGAHPPRRCPRDPPQPYGERGDPARPRGAAGPVRRLGDRPPPPQQGQRRVHCDEAGASAGHGAERVGVTTPSRLAHVTRCTTHS